MEKNMDNFTDIFLSSNLNDQSFYLHCSFIDDEEKNEMIQTIIKNKGVSIIYYILLYLI